MDDRNHYRLLAGLFEYPDADYPEKIDRVRQFLDGKYVDATVELDEFIKRLPDDDLLTMQELFTRSFDVQAIATLDIGYVLFGDDYKRGELLANLNQECRLIDGAGKIGLAERFSVDRLTQRESMPSNFVHAEERSIECPVGCRLR